MSPQARMETVSPICLSRRPCQRFPPCELVGLKPLRRRSALTCVARTLIMIGSPSRSFLAMTEAYPQAMGVRNRCPLLSHRARLGLRERCPHRLLLRPQGPHVRHRPRVHEVLTHVRVVALSRPLAAHSVSPFFFRFRTSSRRSSSSSSVRSSSFFSRMFTGDPA